MENAKVLTCSKIGLPNVAQGGGGSAVDEGGTPVFGGVVELFRAEGMEMDRNSALFEFHLGV